MTEINRLYADLTLKMVTDYARENVFGELEIEQDADLMDSLHPPVSMKLAAGAAATQVIFPLGYTVCRFLAVYKVSTATGVNVRLGGAVNDPILVKPPDGVSKEGFIILMTDVASVYVDNPSSDDDVTFKIMLGFDES